MSFVQAEFLAFFAVVFTVYWMVGARRWQNAVLLLASAVFYGWIHPWFLGLLYFSTLLDFGCGIGLAHRPDRKRVWIALSLIGNLGMLGTFKYFDFFAANVAAALTSIGLGAHEYSLGLLLPVGISFYTFQTMSYTLDVARGKAEACTDLLDYAVFVGFSPQLGAAPIERASALLPQVQRPREWSIDAVRSGFGLALWGATKKVVIADTVAPYVDKIFTLSEPVGPLVWLGALGFAIQILADFSGYTDIARGTARMLGFELSGNFDHPYLATTPSDFWRRWHISYSTWIRDYLYIPLGGSRHGWARTTAATLMALLLSGLWHGASWNFVLWGAYHAALITAYRVVTPRIPTAAGDWPGARTVKVGLMFAFTCVGWLIFREPFLDRLLQSVQLNPLVADAAHWRASAAILGVFAGCALPLIVAIPVERHVLPKLQGSPWRLPVETTAWTACAIAVYACAPVTPSAFIYFQF